MCCFNEWRLLKHEATRGEHQRCSLDIFHTGCLLLFLRCRNLYARLFSQAFVFWCSPRVRVMQPHSFLWTQTRRSLHSTDLAREFSTHIVETVLVYFTEHHDDIPSTECQLGLSEREREREMGCGKFVVERQPGLPHNTASRLWQVSCSKLTWCIPISETLLQSLSGTGMRTDSHGGNASCTSLKTGGGVAGLQHVWVQRFSFLKKNTHTQPRTQTEVRQVWPLWAGTPLLTETKLRRQDACSGKTWVKGALTRAGPVHLGALSRIILGPCFVVDRINFATENKQLYAFITLYFIFFVPLWTRFKLFYYLLSILTETVKVKLTHLPHFYFYFS